MRVGRKMVLAFGALIATLALSSIVFLVAQQRAASARAWMEHTREVIEDIMLLRAATLDQESALRGYLLSGAPDFLATYDAGRKQFEQALAALFVLTSDDAAQQARLQQAQAIAGAWRSEFAEPAIRLAEHAETRPQAVASVVRREGRRHADALRQLYSQMSAEEARLLEARRQHLQRADQLMVWLTAGLLGLGVALGVFATRTTTRLIAGPLRMFTELMPRLASGDRELRIPHLARRDEIGKVAQALEGLRGANLRQHERDWIKSRLAEISGALQHCDSHQDFGATLLRLLSPALGAGYGLAYRYDENIGLLEYCAGYGTPEARAMQQRFRPGEGLPGQCAIERKLLQLAPVPAEHFKIMSGLGGAAPDQLLFAPLLARNEIVAVLELAAFGELDAVRRELLEEVLVPAGLAWQTLSRSIRTRELLEETQAQSEELQASGEALRAQQEQLRTTNETLRERSRMLEEQGARLHTSREQLRAQTEELRVTNAALEERSEALSQRQEELEQARGELERKAVDLEQASRYKSEFLANMSHELRTPLNSLLILAKDLADNGDGNLTDEQIESARIVHDSGKNLLTLINDILDLSKVEAGKMQLVLEDLGLDAFARIQERNFRHVAQERGLKFEVQCDAGLPQTIHTDSTRLGQIVVNLLSNAFKFTHHGGVTLRIARPPADMQLQRPELRDGAAVAFSVTDTGIGIPRDKLQRVFQAFEQADGGTSRRYGGTGLGLSIVRGMAELLGGEVHAVSAADQGSTFTLVLPERHAPSASLPAAALPPAAVILPAAAVEPPPAEVVFPAPPAAASAEPALLIVEDDAVFARLLAEIAERKHLRTHIASTGAAALEYAGTQPLLAVLLDLGLPDMSGWQVMEALKTSPATRNVPVHIVSASDDAARGIEAGAVGFLVKPVSKDAVLGVLDQVAGPDARGPRRLLLIDDDAASRHAVHKLLQGERVEVIDAVDGTSGLQALTQARYDCIILDLGLPDISGFEWLERAARLGELPPVVVYSARELTPEENLRLREYTESIVIKGTRSPERLLDEVSLFLHAIHRPQPAYVAPPRPEQPAADIAGKTVLIVDDDMRNIFALSKTLRARGLKVAMAQDGYKAIAQLEGNPEIDLVLMDIMMPGMDGYETIRRIRERDAWRQLPIIAVTAKAMRGDREKCIEAGANDYCAKPIDIDQLMSQIRVWM